MNLELVAERYSRLKRDLACAYESWPWQSSRIDRIADELVAVERELILISASNPRPDVAQPPALVGPFADHAGQGQHAESC